MCQYLFVPPGRKMIGFLCLVCERSAGTRGWCLRSQREGWVTCPGPARRTPALPNVLPRQLRRAAEDPPLPLSCGPAPSRLKWRRPPWSLGGSGWCVALPGRPGRTGRRWDRRPSLPAALLRAVLSASRTGRLRVGDPRRSMLCGKRGEIQRGGVGSPRAPRGVRAGLSRRHGRSRAGSLQAGLSGHLCTSVGLQLNREEPGKDVLAFQGYFRQK